MLTINVIGLANLTGRRLSRQEVCDRLGFSTSTFDRRVRTGLLKIERDHSQLVAGRPLTYVSLIELGRFLNVSDEHELLARLNMLAPGVEPATSLVARPAIELPYSTDERVSSANFAEHEPVPDDLDAILREAVARGCLIKGHPDLVGRSPEAQTPRFVPVRFHQPARTHGSDPRTMGPQPQPAQSGYGNAVDSAETNELWHSGSNALIQRKP
jgi:hypothetical protein